MDVVNLRRDPHGRYAMAMVTGLAVGLSALSFTSEELFAQSEPRESEVCLDCHEDQATGLDATPHRLNMDALDGLDARVTCSDCHPGDASHYEDDPEEYPRVNPADLTPAAMSELCSSCHMNSHQQNMAEGNVHPANGLNCSTCHSIHEQKAAHLLQADQTELCVGCHTDVAGHFARAYRHPVTDGIVACTDCHQTLDVTSRELSWSGSNTPCMSCHAEFSGPFPFEHQASIDYSTEEGGCQACHDPHGSNLPRLLKQPYEAPHYQLCSQCHSVPGHNNNSMHGTMWAGVSCSECHSDIHGSFVSPLFLSETLQPQGCFNSGCHQF
jgi:DmsE family decaheme c-type cytochrome